MSYAVIALSIGFGSFLMAPFTTLGPALLWVGSGALLTGYAYLSKARGRQPEAAIFAGGPLRRLARRFLLLPHGLIAIVVLKLLRRGEEMAHQIEPRLWLGGAPLPGDRARVEALHVRGILNVCYELGDAAGLCQQGWNHLRVPTLDGMAVDPAGLERLLAWVRIHLEAGEGVLIHCAHGRGRSAAAMAAVLLDLGVVDDVDGALAHMRRHRPQVKLSPHQREGLEQFWRERTPGQDLDPVPNLSAGVTS